MGVVAPTIVRRRRSRVRTPRDTDVSDGTPFGLPCVTEATRRRVVPGGVARMAVLNDTERMIVDTVHEFVDRDVRPVVQRDRARQRVPGEDDRADEGARHLRVGDPRGARRHEGVDAVLRARHRGAGPRVDEPRRGDGRPHRGRPSCSSTSAPTSSRPTYLPRMATGEVRATMALTEPGGGSDLQAMRTVAVLDGDHYVVNGSKTWITNARRSGPDRPDVQDRPGRGAAPPRHQHPARRARAGADRLQGPAQARLQGRRELRADLRGLRRRRPRRCSAASRAAASRR